MLLLLAACGTSSGPASGGATAAEYTPSAGTVLEYAVQGALEALYPEGDTGADTASAAGTDTGASESVPTIRLTVNDTLWEIEDDNGPIGALEYRMDSDGLWVGSSHLLPARLAEGETGEGVTVTAIGPTTVWYGSFDPSGTVTVDSGELAGTNVLAEALGPIALTYAGQVWELVYYERPIAE